jgi:hypothetical protein
MDRRLADPSVDSADAAAFLEIPAAGCLEPRPHLALDGRGACATSVQGDAPAWNRAGRSRLLRARGATFGRGSTDARATREYVASRRLAAKDSPRVSPVDAARASGVVPNGDPRRRRRARRASTIRRDAPGVLFGWNGGDRERIHAVRAGGPLHGVSPGRALWRVWVGWARAVPDQQRRLGAGERVLHLGGRSPSDRGGVGVRRAWARGTSLPVGGTRACGRAVGSECPVSATVPRSTVGSSPWGRSWMGAEDLAGSMWEWVADWYHSGGALRDPRGPATGTMRCDSRRRVGPRPAPLDARSGAHVELTELPRRLRGFPLRATRSLSRAGPRSRSTSSRRQLIVPTVSSLSRSLVPACLLVAPALHSRSRADALQTEPR